MCGRYVATSPPGVLSEYFHVDEVRDAEGDPSWNVAPTDPVPAIVMRRGVRRLGRLRWGLVPSWAKDPGIGSRMINARADSLTTKPAYRAAFARRRCLLPADGFYEWQKIGEGPKGKPLKQPWYIQRADGAPLAFAGLWEVWRPPGEDREVERSSPLRTCTLLTTDANDLMAPIHDRMPVLLDPQDWDQWLDPDNTDLDPLSALLVPADPRLLVAWPVGPGVNSVRHTGPELVVAAPGS